MVIERGAIVTIAAKGPDIGNPRAAVIIQNNDFDATASLTLCAITTDLVQGASLLRIDVAPGTGTGLRQPCQIQIEKIVTVPRANVGERIGQLDGKVMERLDTAIRYFLAL